MAASKSKSGGRPFKGRKAAGKPKGSKTLQGSFYPSKRVNGVVQMPGSGSGTGSGSGGVPKTRPTDGGPSAGNPPKTIRASSASPGRKPPATKAAGKAGGPPAWAPAYGERRKAAGSTKGVAPRPGMKVVNPGSGNMRLRDPGTKGSSAVSAPHPKTGRPIQAPIKAAPMRGGMLTGGVGGGNTGPSRGFATVSGGGKMPGIGSTVKASGGPKGSGAIRPKATGAPRRMARY